MSCAPPRSIKRETRRSKESYCSHYLLLARYITGGLRHNETETIERVTPPPTPFAVLIFRAAFGLPNETTASMEWSGYAAPT